MTIPEEMVEAARMDGCSPMRFFFDILVPISKTNIAALFVILFIFGIKLNSLFIWSNWKFFFKEESLYFS